jgi:hypothetical protein
VNVPDRTRSTSERARRRDGFPRSGPLACAPGSILPVLAFSLFCGFPFGGPARAVAAAPDAQLRWGLQPGLLETYAVTIDRRSSLQSYQTRQEGKLTRMFLAGSQPGQWNCAQMLELDQGRAVRVAGSPAPTTSPADRIVALVPVPHTQLTVGLATQTDASLIVPGGSSFERDLMRAILEWGDWPEQGVGVGARWSRDFAAGSLAGPQRFLVESFDETARNRPVVQIALTADLKNRAGPSATYRVTGVTGTIRWAFRSKRLVEFRGHAVFTRNRAGADERIELDVIVQPKSRTLVSIAEHNASHEQITELAAAIREYNADRLVDAQGELGQFVRRWPGSRWRPVADFLVKQIAAEQASAHFAAGPTTSAPADALHNALVATLAQWRVATQRSDAARTTGSRESLERLARANRAEIVKLAESADASERALACLGLAFAGAPADVAVISGLTEDANTTVREIAYYALVIRASPLVGADVLIRGTEDAVASVRARACEAIAACVRPDSPEAATLATELAPRLTDESPRVRAAAARALAAIGTREHVEPLERAANDPASQSVRPDLQDALRELKTRLEAKPGDKLKTDPRNGRLQ